MSSCCVVARRLGASRCPICLKLTRPPVQVTLQLVDDKGQPSYRHILYGTGVRVDETHLVVMQKTGSTSIQLSQLAGFSVQDKE